jgi:hypothetical protein
MMTERFKRMLAMILPHSTIAYSTKGRFGLVRCHEALLTHPPPKETLASHLSSFFVIARENIKSKRMSVAVN